MFLVVGVVGYMAVDAVGELGHTRTDAVVEVEGDGSLCDCFVPTAVVSINRELEQDYDSKLIGYVRSTLDHSQLETVLSGIQVTDIAAIWEKLLETYQPKTSGSRISVLQEMMAL